jgi:hypothetical protein
MLQEVFRKKKKEEIMEKSEVETKKARSLSERSGFYA